ncbi:unnamed protein product [Ilex paraguariensis]|uniref:Protein TIC 40, chloroplastic n=1 Tax=Ilex paraguariensis TaxID=185542 RepID=A0ABC8TD40_9AQUA
MLLCRGIATIPMLIKNVVNSMDFLLQFYHKAEPVLAQMRLALYTSFSLYFADQIGLTPEEVISKIMANPDVAMAFQNPRVQAAIMECSQNPLSIAKYQNDKEVMDVFNKISELFPGVTGSS